MKKRLFLLIATPALLAACVSEPAGPPPNIEGTWVVSSYEERGTRTLRRDGEQIRITPNGGIYRLDGPDFIIQNGRFAWDGYSFAAQVIPDTDDLQDMFRTTPAAVVQQAAASKTGIYNVSLTPMPDGTLAVAKDNLRINYSREGRFTGFERFPGWWKFRLRRQ